MREKWDSRDDTPVDPHALAFMDSDGENGSLLRWLCVELSGPGPFSLEFLNMLTDLHWNPGLAFCAGGLAANAQDCWACTYPLKQVSKQITTAAVLHK